MPSLFPTPRLTPALAAAALALQLGCINNINLPVLQPADVYLPSHIQTIAVVDRSRVSGAGQGVLGAIEGALTGEAIGADAQGRSQATRGVTETLRNSPRFDVVIPAVDRQGAGSNLFSQNLDWKTAIELCKEAGCQAIVALEAFDSDSHYEHSTRVDETTNDDGKVIKTVMHTVERETNVTVAWRLYDIEKTHIIDDIRDLGLAQSWSEEARSEQEALHRLPSQIETVGVVGYDIGVLYGQRIAPSWITVSRGYYSKGHDQLKMAKRYVQAGDWDGASEIWQGLLTSPDTKVRGRAEFNLALANEVGGYLEDALGWARKAAVDLHNNRARNYVVMLEQRLRDIQRLQEQMAPPQTQQMH